MNEAIQTLCDEAMRAAEVLDGEGYHKRARALRDSVKAIREAEPPKLATVTTLRINKETA